ncbi:MAG: MltA domain-containing protein [Thermodesulfobacteriota bacterium]
MNPSRLLAWALAALACLAWGCEAVRPKVPALAPASESAARAVARGLDPSGQDLASWRDLEPGLRRSLAWLAAKPADGVAVPGPPRITWGRLAATAQRLLDLLPQLDADPGLLAREFAWAELAPRPLMTGYYAPILEASPSPTPEFPYPLYALPPDVQTVDLGRFHPRWAGQTLTYRVRDGRIEPYPDRAAIDRGGALAGRGLELAWVRDRFDAYVLQVQGSGLLRFPDGSLRHALYAGKNGREYVSLGKVMAESGLIPLEQVTMTTIREYLDAHPSEEEALLERNPSYVFFRLADQGPLGAMGRLLTPRVSVATDPGVLPLGSVLALSADLPPGAPGSPDAAGRALAGLVLAQDTGGAIKQARLDFYCGSGPQAGALAGELKARARVWLLLVREDS